MRVPFRQRLCRGVGGLPHVGLISGPIWAVPCFRVIVCAVVCGLIVTGCVPFRPGEPAPAAEIGLDPEDRTSTFIAWSDLKNPIYAHDGWSVKDACMEYHNGWFYLFFSAFYNDDGRERSHIVGVRTRDFRNYSDPLWIWDGRDDGWIGLCSPNITCVGQTWYLTLNSWGDKKGKPNQLFYAESQDLQTWSAIKPLAAQVTRNNNGPVRAIDAALAWTGNRFILLWKENQTVVLAEAPVINSDRWRRIGTPSLPWFENGQLLEISGRWHLLATAIGHDPQRDHLPHLSPMLGDGTQSSDWLHWAAWRQFEIPRQPFNSDGRANAAYLADWRSQDGFFYLLYAGRTESHSHAGRGDNRLGLARSRDLVHWEVPPDR